MDLYAEFDTRSRFTRTNVLKKRHISHIQIENNEVNRDNTLENESETKPGSQLLSSNVDINERMNTQNETNFDNNDIVVLTQNVDEIQENRHSSISKESCNDEAIIKPLTLPKTLLLQLQELSISPSRPKSYILCPLCKNVVITFARLLPCQHCFCYDCSTSASSICPFCKQYCNSIETFPNTVSLYYCSIPTCMCCFLTKESLNTHRRRNHNQIENPVA
ncbi:hypothetical protein WA158_003762 [Blastocystis sp. Blastoise]